MTAALALADPAVCSAFSAGWLAAQLRGPILSQPPGASVPLPTINEMGRADRITLAIDELGALFTGGLAGALKPSDGEEPITMAEMRAAGATSDLDAVRAALDLLHVTVLTRLTVAGGRLGSAYSLGRSLSDTCWLPHTRASFRYQFSRYRLANLQSWLADLATCLPPGTAAAVSQSLDHWAAWAQVHAHLDWDGDGEQVTQAAEAQGEHWRSLLAGDKDPASLLTPEAYVEAGEKALGRAQRIIWRVVVHFWALIAVIALVVAGIVAIAVVFAAGTAKLWGSLVPLAAGLGVTGASVKTAATRLARDAGKPLLDLATTDAMGWACTWLPAVAETRKQQKALRRRGVAPEAVRAVVWSSA